MNQAQVVPLLAGPWGPGAHHARPRGRNYLNINMGPTWVKHYLTWLVVSTPLKNISQLEWLFPIYGKIKKCSKPPTSDSYILNALSARLILYRTHVLAGPNRSRMFESYLARDELLKATTPEKLGENMRVEWSTTTPPRSQRNRAAEGTWRVVRTPDSFGWWCSPSCTLVRMRPYFMGEFLSSKNFCVSWYVHGDFHIFQLETSMFDGDLTASHVWEQATYSSDRSIRTGQKKARNWCWVKHIKVIGKHMVVTRGNFIHYIYIYTWNIQRHIDD